jgi:small subunit ribosomal protein S1
VKQLFDDPWPTIFSEFPPGKLVEGKVLSIVDYGVFIRIRDGVEGLVPQNELVEPKGEDGAAKPFKVGDSLEAEIANIDTQDRRLTLSMRVGEHAPVASEKPAKAASEKRESTKAPKKAAEEGKAGGTIGELIKQKLGAQLGLKEDEKKD